MHLTYTVVIFCANTVSVIISRKIERRQEQSLERDRKKDAHSALASETSELRCFTGTSMES